MQFNCNILLIIIEWILSHCTIWPVSSGFTVIEAETDCSNRKELTEKVIIKYQRWMVAWRKINHRCPNGAIVLGFFEIHASSRVYPYLQREKVEAICLKLGWTTTKNEKWLKETNQWEDTVNSNKASHLMKSGEVSNAVGSVIDEFWRGHGSDYRKYLRMNFK